MRRLLVAFFLLIAALPARASDGLAIEITGGGKTTSYSIDELEALGLDTIETTTTWTDGKQRFEGIRLARLAEALGISGGKLIVSAINDYQAEIEVDEILKYPAMLAIRQNGERMPVRDKGPGWIVYPRDDFPELADERHNFKWVWQVKSIRFE